MCVIFTDLSKAFDSLYHTLTLTRIKRLWRLRKAVGDSVMVSYSTDRYNWVKLESVVSVW